MWTEVGPRNHVLDGVTDPHTRRDNEGKKTLCKDMPRHV